MAQLRARLHKHQVVLLGFLLALLSRDFALVVQVRLVADKHNDDIVSSFGAHIVYPLLCVLEGLSICFLKSALVGLKAVY